MKLTQDFIDEYELRIANIQNSDMSNKGKLRAAKGILVESPVFAAVRSVWSLLDGNPKRIVVNRKKIRLLSPHGHWNAAVDCHVFIDKKLILAIECKAYSEMAMMKRIFADMQFLSPAHACLVQLEHMFGQQASEQLAFLSDKSGVSLDIFTLLEDENRYMHQPIHDKRFHKTISYTKVENFIKYLQTVLGPHC